MSEFRFPPLPLQKLSTVEAALSTPSNKPQYLLPSSKARAMVMAAAFYRAELFSFVHKTYPDGDRGKIYYPAWIFGSLNVKGLVLMAHGELSLGYDKPYQYSMDHIGSFLAMLGFVCISVQPRRSLKYPYKYSDGTGDSILRHLDNINGSFGGKFYIKGKPIALIGHSQAGAAVISSGIFIRNHSFAGYSKVDAIVALAGTAPGQADPASLRDSFLGMQGTLDGDSNSILSPNFGVKVYESLRFSERYFLWMHGCNHRQYTKPDHSLDYDPDIKGGGSLGLIHPKTQNSVASQYIAMFLLWKLAAKTEYRSVFLGDEYVKFVSPNKDIQSDYDSLLRVFPRFDRPRMKNLGDLPSAAVFQQMLQGDEIISNANPAVFDALEDLESTCAGHTVRGFVVGWDLERQGAGIPVMRVTCYPQVLLGAKAIEFHAIIIAQPGKFFPEKPVAVRAYLMHGSSAMVSVLIEPPWSGTRQASILSTIRIPMAMFGLIDDQLKVVTGFALDFAKADRVKGLVAISGFRVSST